MNIPVRIPVTTAQRFEVCSACFDPMRCATRRRCSFYVDEVKNTVPAEKYPHMLSEWDQFPQVTS